MHRAAIRRVWIEEVKSNPNRKSNPNVQKQRYKTISFFRSEGERAGAPPAPPLRRAAAIPTVHADLSGRAPPLRLRLRSPARSPRPGRKKVLVACAKRRVSPHCAGPAAAGPGETPRRAPPRPSHPAGGNPTAQARPPPFLLFEAASQRQPQHRGGVSGWRRAGKIPTEPYGSRRLWRSAQRAQVSTANTEERDRGHRAAVPQVRYNSERTRGTISGKCGTGSTQVSTIPLDTPPRT